METMTGPGTEKRIDDLRSEMHLGFARVDSRFDRAEGDIRELRSSIASFQRMMIGFFATTLGAIVAGVIVNVILSHP